MVVYDGSRVSAEWRSGVFRNLSSVVEDVAPVATHRSGGVAAEATTACDFTRRCFILGAGEFTYGLHTIFRENLSLHF